MWSRTSTIAAASTKNAHNRTSTKGSSRDRLQCGGPLLERCIEPYVDGTGGLRRECDATTHRMSEPWLDRRSIGHPKTTDFGAAPGSRRSVATRRATVRPCDRAPKLSSETLARRNGLSTVLGYRLLASAPEDWIAAIRDDIQQCLYLS